MCRNDRSFNLALNFLVENFHLFQQDSVFHSITFSLSIFLQNMFHRGSRYSLEPSMTLQNFQFPGEFNLQKARKHILD